MHEIGLCEGLLGAVEQAAGGRRVSEVRVRVGARHAVVAEAFEQAFTLVTAGTVAEGATVDVVITPVTVTCPGPGHRSESLDVLAVCPRCGSDAVELTGGDEMVLESIQLGTEEQADVPWHTR